MKGALIVDDTVQEKAQTDESELMCWHYDHASGPHARGINLLNALYNSNGASIPVAFELVTRPTQYSDIKTRKLRRKSEVTKNELMRQMIQSCINNDLKFRFVFTDSWFSSEENVECITARGKHFISAIKDNRLVALSEEDKKHQRFTRVDELQISEHGVVRGWLEGYAKEVLVVRQRFENKDDSTGTLHLVCSNITCDHDAITTTYKRRWEVQVFHQSLKSNASLARSPTKTTKTQSNHAFMSICAAFKLACLSLKHKLSPFAMCRKLLINASQAAYAELQLLWAVAA
jgi:SRSO17 transposase